MTTVGLVGCGTADTVTSAVFFEVNPGTRTQESLMYYKKQNITKFDRTDQTYNEYNPSPSLSTDQMSPKLVQALAPILNGESIPPTSLRVGDSFVITRTVPTRFTVRETSASSKARTYRYFSNYGRTELKEEGTPFATLISDDEKTTLHLYVGTYREESKPYS